MSSPTPRGSTIIPCIQYRDAHAAIDWLCDVMGFERQLVVPGEGGTIRHAQLRSAHGMIMLGTAQDPQSKSEYQKLMRLPSENGGVNTQSIYLVVDDADAVYARVQATGVPIDLPIIDEPYGGRGFTCRDPEGHVWSVGSYDPWQE